MESPVLYPCSTVSCVHDKDVYVQGAAVVLRAKDDDALEHPVEHGNANESMVLLVSNSSHLLLLTRVETSPSLRRRRCDDEDSPASFSAAAAALVPSSSNSEMRGAARDATGRGHIALMSGAMGDEG
jgi:hypothetical protein